MRFRTGRGPFWLSHTCPRSSFISVSSAAIFSGTVWFTSFPIFPEPTSRSTWSASKSSRCLPANEDMWHLYNLVMSGDELRASTYRKVVSTSSTGSTRSDKKKITLTLAGTGPQQGHLIDLAAALGVQAEIGRVSDERLKALYQTADVFVQTSAVELEGMSVLEAMAAGCPVLINRSETSAVPEFVGAPEATYAMNEVAYLTRKLEALLEKPELRAAAGQENRQIAQSRHHDQSVNTLAQLYRRVLGEY